MILRNKPNICKGYSLNKMITSENAERLIQKLKDDQLCMYYNPNQGPNFISEFAFENYLNYKNFLKTGIFYRIAFTRFKLEK